MTSLRFRMKRKCRVRPTKTIRWLVNVAHNSWSNIRFERFDFRKCFDFWTRQQPEYSTRKAWAKNRGQKPIPPPSTHHCNQALQQPTSGTFCVQFTGISNLTAAFVTSPATRVAGEKWWVMTLRIFSNLLSDSWSSAWELDSIGNKSQEISDSLVFETSSLQLLVQSVQRTNRGKQIRSETGTTSSHFRALKIQHKDGFMEAHLSLESEVRYDWAVSIQKKSWTSVL